MKRFLIVLVLLLALLALAPFAAFFAVRAYYEPGLPDISGLRDIPMGRPVRVLSADGKLLAEYGVERRTPLPLSAFPRQVINAFLAAEDDNFYQHPGVDWKGLARAGWIFARTHVRAQGGSTITMQLARNVFLTPEKSWERKVREILLAMKIERELSKDEILDIYLNRIFLGTRAYGVGAAAKVYFGKDVQQLTLAEAATIAALPKAPSQLNPIVAPQKAQARRAYVLGRMRQLNMISDADYQEAMAEPMLAFEHTAKPEVDAPDMAEMVRQDLLARFGESVYTSGYTVVTTLDSRLQEAANTAVRFNLLNYEERHGWDGPDARAKDGTPEELLAAAPRWPELEPGIVVGTAGGQLTLDTRDAGRLTLPARATAWAGAVGRRAHAGDRVWLRHVGTDNAWRLTNTPHVQGALVSLDADDGAIRAMVGGYDWRRGQFNRAVQAFRQAGSSFKPFLYACALEHSETPASVFLDAPIVYQNADGTEWKPENYSKRFSGPMRLREALVQSRNTVSVRILEKIGVPTALECASRLGLPRERLPASLSLSLGTADLSPLQLARGYATFANGGVVVSPYAIASIQDANGNEVLKAKPVKASDPQATRAMDARTIYLIDNIMHDVATRGTAAASNVLERDDLAGKTGTSNNQRDAWFTGFNGRLVTTVWMGFDQPADLGEGETGGHTALPMWIDYTRLALAGVPSTFMARPEGLADIKINPRTGFLARAGDPTAIDEIVPEDRIPYVDDNTDPGSMDYEDTSNGLYGEPAYPDQSPDPQGVGPGAAPAVPGSPNQSPAPAPGGVPESGFYPDGGPGGNPGGAPGYAPNPSLSQTLSPRERDPAPVVRVLPLPAPPADPGPRGDTPAPANDAPPAPDGNETN